MKDNKCTCDHCATYDKYKWATINECGCSCHQDSDIHGHSGLCCEFTNGERALNPHAELEQAAFYKEELDRWEREAYEEMAAMPKLTKK